MAKRFRGLFRLSSREPSVTDDVEQEIATHLEQVVEWYVAQGVRPDLAREQARQRFGDLDQFRREIGAIDRSVVRRRRFGERLASFGSDLAIAWRGLRRSPGYAVVVIGTLGLALGANATMFGVVDRLLLQPPPGIVAPDEVKRVQAARWFDDHYSEPWDAVSFPSFVGVRDQSKALSHVAAVVGATLSFGIGAEAAGVSAVFASGRYFDLLGATPSLGRFFGDGDDQPPAGTPVVVLSDRFWRTTMAADSSVLGRAVVLNGQSFTVIGVTQPRFNGTDLAPIDLWVPFHAIGPLVQGTGSPWETGRGWQWLNILVRIRPGTSLEQAASDATSAYRSANADFQPFEAKAEVSFRPLTAYTEGAGPERVAGWLYGVTLVVLLIACANIANVVLARGIVRRTETAVRQALGIPRGRLIRQYVAETALVVGLGFGLGLILTRWGGLMVRRLLLTETVWNSDPINLRVLATTAAAATASAVLASLWPLIRSARVDPAAELHGAGRSTTRVGATARRGLLLVQTTLTTALVVAAALFLRSIATVRGLDYGIDPNNAYLVSIDLSGRSTPTPEVEAVYRAATERIRRLPGVEAAGITFGAPFLSNSGGRIKVPGKDSIPRLEGGGPYFFAIGPGTLRAYGARLLQGRDFGEADRRGSAPVVIVSERMAKTIWPGESPIGKCFIVGADSMPCREIVGVVADLHRQGLDEEPFFLYFSVLEQATEPTTPQHVVVRMAPGQPNPAEMIRKALLAERPDLPFVPVVGYRDVLGAQARQWALGASLLTVFGLLSLVIAAIGLYGVIAFGVSQRTKEIGLRAALGASPRRLLWGVIGGGVATAGVGVALGLALALAAGGRLESLLFKVRAADPIAFGAAAAAVIAVSLVAAWLPGRKALRIDPVRALRSD